MLHSMSSLETHIQLCRVVAYRKVAFNPHSKISIVYAKENECGPKWIVRLKKMDSLLSTLYSLFIVINGTILAVNGEAKVGQIYRILAGIIAFSFGVAIPIHLTIMRRGLVNIFRFFYKKKVLNMLWHYEKLNPKPTTVFMKMN